VRDFGPPDVLALADLPDPVPGPEQVLVAVSASDVLFVDTLIRSGAGRGYFPVRPPYVPGNGVGGEIVAVGAGVSRDWLGRRAAAHTGGPGGTTALRILQVCDIRPGEPVLVLGAAGGMGILLVQLLAAQGVRVIGAARGKAKREAVAAAGALAAVDYGQPDWTDAVLAAADGARPAVVLDGVGGSAGTAAFGLMADGGLFSAHGTPSGSFAAIDSGTARHRRVRVSTIRDLQFGPGDRSRLMKDVIDRLAARQIAPLIGQTFSLAEARKAHEAIEARQTVAKTLLLNR